MLAVCSVVMMVSVCSCGKPEYLKGNNESSDSDYEAAVVGEDVADKYGYLKRGSYRYATNNKGLFYIVSVSNVISYYDYSTGMSTVWCNKAACKHTDNSCSAYVESDLEYVEYYNGYVYKMEMDESGLYLTRFKEDGTDQTRLANLLEGYDSAAIVEYGRVYDGCMYFLVRNDSKKADVKCVDLMEKNKINMLFSLDLSDTIFGMSGLFVNNSSIYLSLTKTAYDGSDSYKSIVCYDRNSETLRELSIPADTLSCCANDNLYYFTKSKSLYCINSDGEIELHPGMFTELPYDDYGINCNEKYIIFVRHPKEAMLGGNSDIYIYDIANDKLSCVEDLKNESETESSDETPSGSDNIIRISSVNKRFLSLAGLTGRYALFTGIGEQKMCLVDLESGKVFDLDIDIIKSSSMQ